MKIFQINKRLCSLWLLTILLLFSACRKKKIAAPLDPGCSAVTMAGRLTRNAATDTYQFKTTDGGRIKMELGTNIGLRRITITHDDYPSFEIELWGDTTVNGENRTSANHENLNGKHIKDRIGSRRTIIFPGGAKITLITHGRKGPLTALSIYDGAESHRINPACNTLINSTTELLRTQQLDKEEADGETAGFEITPTGLLYFQLYNEETDGTKTETRIELGEIFRNNANQVNDYFDDPSLAAT